MAKFYGTIGFAETMESPVGSGIWIEQIIERTYPGEIIRHRRRWEQGERINDNVSLSNEISIVADPYLYRSIGQIRYVEYMGSKWRVTDVEDAYPRIKLTVGGVYNGEKA